MDKQLEFTDKDFERFQVSRHCKFDEPTMNDVVNVLEEDKKNRHKHGELFIRPMREAIPLSHYKDIKIFNPKMEGVLVAGGYASNCIFASEFNDIDLFLYGDINPEVKVKEIINHFNPKGVIRTKKYMEFICGNMTKVQIILRHYNTVAEILYGFDVGSAQCGFNEKCFYSTHLFEFAKKYGCNILDHNRASPSYMYRLYKYMGRGMKIITPWGKVDYNSKYKEYKYGNSTSDYDLSVVPSWKGRYNILYYLGLHDNFEVIGFDKPLRRGVCSFDRNGHPYLNAIYTTHLHININNFKFHKKLFKAYGLKFGDETFHKREREIVREMEDKHIVPPLEFITTNPGTQTTGSFDPLTLNEWDYYGKDFYPIWTPINHEHHSQKERYEIVMEELRLKGIPQDNINVIIEELSIKEIIDNNDVHYV